MSENQILIAPSILAGDFSKLGDESKRMEQAGADAIHIDIMDGHFVKNLTLGPKAVAAINRSTELFLDVHIMVYNPFDYIERLIESGANRITFHFEATEDVEEILEYIRKCNIEAGLAFCPETSPTMVTSFLDKCDLILLMTVHPGFGGQKFLDDMLSKIKLTREMLDTRKIRRGGKVVEENPQSVPPFPIQVDGGIDDQTAKKCIESGANNLVSGTYLFKSPDPRAAIESLRNPL
ncbi:MAG: Ribulose-phosphate 3-epimerase [Chlamydiae bacterium]|nr:Ribulose-phosphate 3-epimerase [Chlamydiota bacterium]